MQAGPESLRPFYGPPRGFSFPREIQPILDRHCVPCHRDRQALPWRSDPRSSPAPDPTASQQVAFSLLGWENPEELSGRKWSDAYVALLQARPIDWPSLGNPLRAEPDGKYVHWISAQSAPPMLPPASTGSARSPLLQLLTQGHHDVSLSREEMEKLACWIDLAVPYCGDYTEANIWTEAEQQKYSHFLDKRQRLEQSESANIQAYLKTLPD